jgi:hypothetical protein
LFIGGFPEIVGFSSKMNIMLGGKGFVFKKFRIGNGEVPTLGRATST